MFKPDSSLMQGIDEWIEKNKEAFVKDLDRLVAIPSISEKGDDTYPFGKNCAQVLDVYKRQDEEKMLSAMQRITDVLCDLARSYIEAGLDSDVYKRQAQGSIPSVRISPNWGSWDMRDTLPWKSGTHPAVPIHMRPRNQGLIM